MKSQVTSLTSLVSAPLQDFGFLGQLFEAMPIVIFIKAMQVAMKQTAQPSKAAR
jgi:hypothetical protein